MLMQAAQRLLERKEITTEEFDLIKSANIVAEHLNEEEISKVAEGVSGGQHVIDELLSQLKAKGPDISYGESGKAVKVLKILTAIAGLGGAGAATVKAGQTIAEGMPKIRQFLNPVKPSMFEQFVARAKPIGIGAAVATGTTLGLKEIYDAIAQKAKIISSYDNMKEKVPILEKFPEEEVKDYFNVVKTFSPTAASNPLVAGALVHKMLEFGGVDHKLVQDLAAIEGMKPDSFFRGMGQAGIKAITGMSKLPGQGED